MKKKSKIKSTFFKFKVIKKTRNYNIAYYNGWNNLSILRLTILNPIKEKIFFENNFIDKLTNREKILILSDGNAFVREKNLKKNLKRFDCIYSCNSFKNLELRSKKGSQLFLIYGSKNFKNDKKIRCFNLENDQKKIDLWGGKCISRVFNGHDMTVVLFKLKKGFEFFDKGHKNEQITWLVKGKMKFHIKNKFKLLSKNKTGVDIGSYDFHGGTSLGAMGFDAFLPKRSEKRYS